MSITLRATTSLPANAKNNAATASALPQNPKVFKIAPDVFQSFGGPNAQKPKKMLVLDVSRAHWYPEALRDVYV